MAQIVSGGACVEKSCASGAAKVLIRVGGEAKSVTFGRKRPGGAPACAKLTGVAKKGGFDVE
jgi:hypothetical protein